MTRQQEFRKQAEEAKFEAFSLMCRKVADLEKENAELEHQLIHRNCLDCSNHSSKLRMRVLELEKENAELKGLKDVATLIRANNDTVVTLMQLNNMLVSKNQQLTKAKEILEKLLFVSCNSDVLNQYPNCSEVLQARVEAEQFLNREEEK